MYDIFRVIYFFVVDLRIMNKIYLYFYVSVGFVRLNL